MTSIFGNIIIFFLVISSFDYIEVSADVADAEVFVDDYMYYYYEGDSSEEESATPTPSFAPSRKSRTHSPTSYAPTIQVVTPAPSRRYRRTTYLPSSAPTAGPGDDYYTANEEGTDDTANDEGTDDADDQSEYEEEVVEETPYPSFFPSPRPTKYPSFRPTPYPTPYPSLNPTRRPTPYPTVRPSQSRPTRRPSSVSPTLFPTESTSHPTSIVIVYTDKAIFGFDVGSRAANIAVLISLVAVIVWLAMSTAFCITRRYNDPTIGGAKKQPIVPKKNRKQKFEEYWGDMDDSTNSMTGFNLDASTSSKTSGITSTEHEKIMKAAATVFESKTNVSDVRASPEVVKAASDVKSVSKEKESSKTSSNVVPTSSSSTKEKKSKSKTSSSSSTTSSPSSTTPKESTPSSQAIDVVSEISTAPLQESDISQATDIDNKV